MQRSCQRTVAIDKRIGDAENWTDYRSSLEQQAGMAAVQALANYRSRLAGALARGEDVPAFNVDLRKVAAG
jgi:hypothetical protein